MEWSDLNSAQYRAVTAKDRHILVMAGAGTGKTRTIIARAHFLIETGADPSRIAILSYTRKSAAEIVSRVKSEIGEEISEGLTGMTFHSFCLDLISRFPDVFGMSGYTLMDQDDQFTCMQMACTDRCVSVRARQIIEVASLCNNTFCTLREAVEKLYYHPDPAHVPSSEEIEERCHTFGQAIAAYNEYKKENKFIDFDDILSIVAETLEADQAARKKVCGSFDHLLIDEMQDTNPLQYKLLVSFAQCCDLFCVGDDAQSIYGFRGADFKSIHSFSKVFPDAVVFPLNLNYRSTQRILDLANWMLAQSPLNYGKVLVADRGDGAWPEMISCSGHQDMADKIVLAIKESHDKGGLWSDHMVMARALYKLRGIERDLIEVGIPVKLFGGISLLKQRHIRLITSPMRIVANWKDIFAWKDYFDLTKWREEGTARVTNFSVDYNGIIRAIVEEPTFADAMSAFSAHADVSEDMVKSLLQISQLQDRPGEAFRLSRETLEDRVRQLCPGGWTERLKDFDVLEDIAERCSNISQFIADYILDPKLVDRNPDDEDAVILSTIHSAKGLEADTCYILDADKEEWPQARSIHDGPEAVEEERRVLYVAMTRAKNHLMLYHTDEREILLTPSFLDAAIEKEFLVKSP